MGALPLGVAAEHRVHFFFLVIIFILFHSFFLFFSFFSPRRSCTGPIIWPNGCSEFFSPKGSTCIAPRVRHLNLILLSLSVCVLLLFVSWICSLVAVLALFHVYFMSSFCCVCCLWNNIVLHLFVNIWRTNWLAYIIFVTILGFCCCHWPVTLLFGNFSFNSI